MNKDVKVILFAVICTILSGLFIIGLLEGESIMEILITIGQIILLLVSTVGTMLFFVWLGTKIFHD